MRKTLKIVLYALLLLLVVAITTVFLFKEQLQQRVLRRLLAEIETTFGNYYQLEVKELQTSLDFTNFSLRLIQPVFTTDTLQRDYSNRYPPIFFQADSVLVSGLNLRSLFFGKDIRLHEIILSNPSLKLFSHDSTKNDNFQTKANNKRKRIDNISLAQLRIEAGDISLLNVHRQMDTLYYGESIDLTLGQTNLALQQSGPFLKQLRLKSLVFAMENVEIRPIGTAYAFEMERLIFDLAGDSLSGKNMKLLPDRSLLQLSRQADYQKTFAKIALGDIAVHGINFPALANNQVELKKVVLDNARFFLLRNKNKVTDPKLFKKSIRQTLADLPVQLHIDSLLIKNMQLEFQLYMPGKSKPAIVRLDRANGLITQLHNKSSSKVLTHLSLKSRIMAHGKLDFQATFTPGKLEHSFKGKIYAMPFSDWNQVVAQMAPLQISSGSIDGIQFSGMAGDMESRGKIIFRYHNLRAELSRTDKSGRIRKANLLSSATNLMLYESNPRTGKQLPDAQSFHFRREAWQGPVMLWVGGLLDGMEATLLSEKKRARLRSMQQKRQKSN